MLIGTRLPALAIIAACAIGCGPAPPRPLLQPLLEAPSSEDALNALRGCVEVRGRELGRPELTPSFAKWYWMHVVQVSSGGAPAGGELLAVFAAQSAAAHEQARDRRLADEPMRDVDEIVLYFTDIEPDSFMVQELKEGFSTSFRARVYHDKVPFVESVQWCTVATEVEAARVASALLHLGRADAGNLSGYRAEPHPKGVGWQDGSTEETTP